MTTPQWRDAPDRPGIWVSTESDVYSKTEWIVFSVFAEVLADASARESFRDGARYYGPIPPDPQQEQP